MTNETHHLFTKIEQDRFALHGLIKRSGFLSPAQLARAREVIFQQFEREGIWKDGQWQLTRQEFIPGVAAGMALVKPLNRHPAIIDLAGGETLAAASALAPFASSRIFCGAVLFVFSDALIAVNRFHTPLPGRDWLVWSTYYAAQFAIVSGYLRETVRQSAVR